MHAKAVDLKEFYDSIQGRVVQRVLRQRLRFLWPDMTGLRVAGFGYPLPYLKSQISQADHLAVLMPREQGAVFWPVDGKNRAVLCDGAEWPIETSSIDRLLLVHGMPGYSDLENVLKESWRVLTGQGSLILIVPNRAGIWARRDTTPFGHGVPYSMSQIRSLLKENYFVPERADRALFMPPSSSRFMLATALMWEKLGWRFLNAFGGVHVVEATKQLYAGTPVGVATVRADGRKRVFASTSTMSGAD